MMKNGEVRSLEHAVEAKFSAVAANYRVSTVHAQGEDLSHMLAAANLRGDEIVLDAGCGAGHASAAFATHVQQVVAYDLSEAMLGEVRHLMNDRGIANVQTRQGSVELIPLQDKSFDLIISRYSAHHWANPMEALYEFRRLLKPGGQFILSDIVSPLDSLLDTWLQTFEVLRDGSHVRDHSVAQWLRMFGDAGLDGREIHHWQLQLEFSSWVRRISTPEHFVDALTKLMADAPSEVQMGFDLTFREDNKGRVIPVQFAVPGALLVGKRRKGSL